MNIIDALKSKLPLKRKCWERFCKNEEFGKSVAYNVSDILADDWEIEEKTITLTKSQFLEAVSETVKELGIKDCVKFQTPFGISEKPYDVLVFSGWTDLCKKLGFK